MQRTLTCKCHHFTRVPSVLFLLSALLLNITFLAAQEAIAPIEAPFEMEQLSRPVFPDTSFDIRDFGAVEGGQIKNTVALRHAIQAATLAGGGTVSIPPGTWLTGAVHLDNNINLHLSKGAELLFSQDSADYLPVVFSRHEDVECFKYSAFIYADGKTNIAITGEGTLNGQGKPWWRWKESRKDAETRLQQMAAEGIPVEQRIFDGSAGNVLRPAFFQPMRCKNVLVEGVTFLYGAFWTITPTYCENVIVRRVRVVTEGEYGHTPNGDGVNPSSCKNVLIEYCQFDTGDDCIAIKSGRDKDGLRVDIPTENVVVRHCRGLSGHGGIVVGSETAGGVRNIYAVDCSFSGTDRIVRIKTARGRGGILENMWFRDLSGQNITQEAIHVNMLYVGKRFPAAEVSESTPRIRNLHFANITGHSCKSYAIELVGLPEMPIRSITFDGIGFDASKGVSCTDVRNVHFSNIAITPTTWPIISITDGECISMESVTIPQGANPVLAVDGPKVRNIRMLKSNTSNATAILSLSPDVPHDAVVVGE